MSKTERLISVFVVSLLLAACSSNGGSDTTEAPATTEAPGTTAAPATTEAPGTTVDAAAAEWQAIVDAAKEEGQLTYYSISPPAVNDRVQEAWSAAYPEISIEIIRIVPADLQPALEAERETGAEGADVVSAVNYAWIYEKSDEGWFSDPVGPAVVGPDSAWVGTEFLVNDQILAVPLGLITLGWNTDLVPEGLTGYEDLLDPRFAGAVSMPDCTFSAIGCDYWSFVEENHVDNFLEQMASQKPVIIGSVVPTMEALAAGEIAVSGWTTPGDMAQMQANDAPVDFVVPDPAYSAQNLFFLPDWVKHPNAAQVFMNFIASPEGQEAVAIYGWSPLEEVQPDTAGGGVSVVLTNIERITTGTWVDDYLANWDSVLNG